MSSKSESLKDKTTENFYEFSQLADYSLMDNLKADPQSVVIKLQFNSGN